MPAQPLGLDHEGMIKCASSVLVSPSGAGMFGPPVDLLDSS